MKFRIRVYVGVGFDATGDRISMGTEISATDRIRDYAIARFGGFTQYDHVGGWKDDRGRDVTEPGRTFEVLADDLFIANPDVSDAIRMKAIRASGEMFARFARSALQQSSVVLTIEPLAVALFIGEPAPIPPAVNQCDGCNLGWPIVNGNHMPPPGEPFHAMHECTADRYPVAPQPD